MTIKLADVIKNYGAPLLGNVIGGPIGATIGGIVNLVANAFGGSSDNPDDLIRRIQGDPDAAIKLATLESNNRLELQKLASQVQLATIDAEQKETISEVQDRDSARKLEDEKIAAGFKDPMYKIVGIVVLVGFLLSIIALLSVDIDADVKDVLFYMLGTLQTAFLAVVFYYFGSSANPKGVTK